MSASPLLVILYHDKDKEYADKLCTALQPSINKQRLRLWHIGMLPAGGSHEHHERQLRRASVLLCLLSAELLADDRLVAQCRQHKSAGKALFPVVVRAISKHPGEVFEKIKLFEAYKEPDQDRARADVVDQLMALLQEGAATTQVKPTPRPRPVRPDPAVTWLKFGGLGGVHGDMWERTLRALRADLEAQGAKRRPDFVLLSGDIAHGWGLVNHDPFERARDLLELIEAVFQDAEIPVLCVPGPGDMEAPQRDSLSQDWLETYKNERYMKNLWEDAGTKHRDLHDLWEPWLSFAGSLRGRLAGDYRAGHMPGDALVTNWRVGGLHLGVLALNSAWRCKAVMGMELPAVVDPRQRRFALQNDQSIQLFNNTHHLRFLLQHHAPSALDQALEPCKVWGEEVMLSDTLFVCGAEAKIGAQAIPCLGLSSSPPHRGYVWGEARLQGERVCVRLWARRDAGVGQEPCFEADEDGIEFTGGLSAPTRAPQTQGEEPTRREQNAREAYLEEAARRWRWLPIPGLEEGLGARLDIKDAYVDLQLSGLKGGGDKTDLKGAVEQARISHKAGLVLVGRPGAGKTTLLKHVLVRAMEGTGALGWQQEMTPVFLRLRRLQQHQLKDGLRGFVVRELQAEGFPEPERLADVILKDKERPPLFLLDGLDEQADEGTREAICQWLAGEIKGEWERARFLMTSRYTGWTNSKALGAHLLRADVLDLNVEAIKTFVERWHGAVAQRHHEHTRDLFEPQRKAAELYEKLMGARYDGSALRHLMGNPLLLSTLCLLHLKRQELPNVRGELYRECMELLLEVWSRRSGRAGLPYRQARYLLQPLAWEMQLRDKAELPAADMKALVEEALERLELELGWEGFLTLAQKDCGVLVESGEDCYAFAHLSFQEYLAALHAQCEGELSVVAAKAGEERWREIVLLLANQDGAFTDLVQHIDSIQEIPARKDLLHRCLGESAVLLDRPFLPLLRRGDDLQTVQVVLELFQKKKTRALKGEVERLLQSPNPQISQLARDFLGVNQTTRTIAGIEFVWVPPGLFWMGSSPDPKRPFYDAEAFNSEKPGGFVELRRGYWMGRFPLLNEEYGRYLKAQQGKTREPEYWSNSRFNQARQPVVGIDWAEAVGYCKWLTQESQKSGEIESGWLLRLPTEAEWERAARGVDGRKYPWGQEAPDEERAVFGRDVSSGSTEAVGGRAKGVSPVGCYDMAGNVWEWCLDEWDDKTLTSMRGSKASKEEIEGWLASVRGVTKDVSVLTKIVSGVTKIVSPCRYNDTLDPLVRVVRGGSWGNGPRGLRCAYRFWFRSVSRLQYLGFRVACAPQDAF